MFEITDDEFSVLMIAAQGQSMIPIGRWKEPTLSLAAKGMLHADDPSNYTITDAGRSALAGRDDEDARAFLESSNKVANARTQAQQSVEQAAIHLSMAARASILVNGDSPEHAINGWLDIVKTRALELMSDPDRRTILPRSS